MVFTVSSINITLNCVLCGVLENILYPKLVVPKIKLALEHNIKYQINKLQRTKKQKGLQQNQAVSLEFLNKKIIPMKRFYNRKFIGHRELQIIPPCVGGVVLRNCGYTRHVIVVNYHEVSFSYVYNKLNKKN